MKIEFVKMHVSGNDFIIIEENRNKNKNLFFNINNIDIEALGHRRKGIGFDQLLTIKAASAADRSATLHIYNSDSSAAETCINGNLCAAWYLAQLPEWSGAADIAITSDKRIFGCKVLCKDFNNSLSNNDLIGLELPIPKALELDKTNEEITKSITAAGLQVSLEIKHLALLSLGNPHLILFLKEKEGFTALKSLAPLAYFIEKAAFFKGGINISIAYIEEEQQQPKIHCRVWERGAGETLSCGSAACCIYFAALQQKLLKPNEQIITLLFPGGETFIDQKANLLFAKTNLVFTGELII